MAHKELPQAVALFHELGWTNAQPKDTPSLSVGSNKQQAAAKRGLSSGEWSVTDYGPDGNPAGDLGGISPYMMQLFALRLGVSPKRVITLFRRHGHSPDYRLIAELVALNGKDYAERFIREALRYRDFDGMEADSEDEFTFSVFFLVTQHFPDLGIPTHINYAEAWALCAAKNMGVRGTTIRAPKNQLPQWKELLPTFAEHFDLCTQEGAQMWNAFGYVIVEAVTRDLITRDTAVALAIRGLDAATRPKQRLRMVSMLCEDLHLTDNDIVAHREAIGGIVAGADPKLVNVLGLRLIGCVPAEELGAAVLPMLYVTTLKGQRDVLTVIKKRTDIPADGRTVLAQRVSELAASSDKKVADIAAGLVAQWGVDVVASTSDEGKLYPWNPTPKLWELPRFVRMEPTYDALIEALTNSDYAREDSFGDAPMDLVTTESEQCVVAYAHLAFEDPEAAKRVKKVIGNHKLFALNMRTDVENFVFDGRPHHVLWRRDYYLEWVMGKVPCIVSEPSYVDLSIDFEDLLHRLEAYNQHGASILCADLMVALTRLNLDGLDISAAAKRARGYSVPVIHTFSQPTERTAGEILADYLTDPFRVPQLVKDSESGCYSGIYSSEKVETPTSLVRFPHDITQESKWCDINPAAAPRWGDAVWTRLRHSPRAKDTDQGLLARQVARSATPLGPATAMNLIGLARPTKKGGINLAYQAISDAWARGLLLPGVADPQYLDWHWDVTKNFAGMAAVALDLADMGMLAVAWPLLDAMLGHSTKPTTKTAELAQAMADLASSVAHAIEEGAAPATAANVSNLRRFAAMKGSNKTSVAARVAMEILPPCTTEDSAVDSSGNSSAPEAVAPPTVGLSGWELPAPEFIDDSLDQFFLAHAHSSPSAITVGLRSSTYPSLSFEADLWDFDSYPSHGFYRVECYRGEESRGYFHMWWDGDSWVLDHQPAQRWRYNSSPLPMFTSTAYILFGMMHSGSRAKNALWYMERFLINRMFCAQVVARSIHALLQEELWAPTQALKLLQAKDSLPVLWPLLTESLAKAATDSQQQHPPAKWLGKVLDAIIEDSAVLKAATEAGFIPETSWNPLKIIAGQKKKTAVVAKARELVEVFGVK